MSHEGFLEQRKTTNRIGLTLVIAGHAAVLTALALAPPEAIRRIIPHRSSSAASTTSRRQPRRCPSPPPSPGSRWRRPPPNRS
ncbi:hypothetical protein [Rhizorhabdus dicambivorans]|uniref:hypothetical protein n=1 Tax=Rhizorhabdus dicambivorans TaxID=1850238 RepID=UPI001EDCB72E|nr:hypothetical protein [Rhizorhabdus dicambivorans]